MSLTLVRRVEKGGALTAADHDNNLDNLEAPMIESLVKTYQFEVDTFKKGTTAPTEVTIGSTPEVRGLRFNATNQKASFTFMTPLDAKPNCDFQMMFMVAIPEGVTAVVGDLINLRVDFRVSAGMGESKLDATGTTVNTQTPSLTGPFYEHGNDNVILTSKNTEYYTYMPHVFLPTASMVPGRVFWGEVSLNSVATGNIPSIVLYQMHCNYFEKSLSDLV
jgi:hypothetical protein